ncbi:MAG: ATP-binding protein [Vulcanimicrobiaceae bacterium]
MRSLRWRIATWYALLLIGVIIALGFIIAWRFQSILLDQATQHVNRTMQEIEIAALPVPNAFSVEDTSIPLQTILASENLERWSSPTTFVQVDNEQGYPLAKSSNMGSLAFPAAKNVTPSNPKVAEVVNTSRGPFLVQSELFIAGKQRLVVQVAEPMDQLLRAFSQTQRALILIIALAAIAVVALSAILASQTVNPINELARAMREIGSDRLNRRLKWKNRQDEVGRLAETFDDLLARLEEAFARERQFITDASHELKTPLTSINANAQMLARWGSEDERIRRESLETIVAESAALAGMVSGMLTLAKADSGDAIPKEPMSLASAANDAVQTTSQRAAEKGLALRFESGKSKPVILGDASLIRQLISNLIDNAIKFTEHGSVTVSVRANDGEGIVEVQDTGPGIAPDELPLIFDRFYRADKSRTRAVPGTGLGLAIVRSIARVHDGRVEAEQAPGGGALFRARFPRIDTPAT